ncbi:GNAT family N-acetyltransferase [Natronolimnohabitans sp. A-GB9]|uniref:GNAT family N-acetyltransferase n=1 Tax=Natronolimnohabitans sp. A-GB9 TaxID=3069757 RepID=UPI0027B60618|nr:GNAT family N-acetyltransferase [Natronolimnohabitans sp. A-GB9]MDQ2050701.1 GNAT family N-acetyltransferase [Natronolimnohabitans sp. A-GB9]
MTREVRSATTDDVWAIHETARESWHAAYDDLLGSDRVDEIVDDWYAIGDLESAITAASERETVVFLVAVPDSDADLESEHGFDGECHGFAHVVPWPEDDSVAYLARLYVHPDRWGDGIGTTLVSRLEDELVASFDRLRLAVLADNDGGIAFCEAMGFDRLATRPNDLAPGLEEYVYEKPL